MSKQTIYFAFIGTFFLGLHVYGLNTLFFRMKRYESLSQVEYIAY